jgi:S-DNA-T family DNA segregation ATPase FtsK/SpoIIIE
VRFLNPTENKRLNELVGFLSVTLAVLLALAMISYSPGDPSFNVAAPSLGDHPVRNWIGPAGSFTADLLFQVLGFAAFLLPMALLTLGWKWFRSHGVSSQTAKLIGYALLLLSLPSLLSLWHLPGVRGAVPAGGLTGTLLAGGLRAGFNTAGANVVAVALFLTAMYMTTRFSFSGAHAWMSRPMGAAGAAGGMAASSRTSRGAIRPGRG